MKYVRIKHLIPVRNIKGIWCFLCFKEEKYKYAGGGKLSFVQTKTILKGKIWNFMLNI